MNITDLIGKRVLATMNLGTWGIADPQEIKILEVSPSGNWVRVMNWHGNKFWKRVSDLGLLEVLNQLEPCPPK